MNSDSFQHELLIADTGPLLALARVEMLPVLAVLFQRVFLPDVVLEECLAKPDRQDAERIRQAVNSGILTVTATLQARPQLSDLDRGEQAAIELAIQKHGCLLLDERRGRRAAKALHLKVIGALGVLLLAKSSGKIPAVSPLLHRLQASGYFLDDSLAAEVLSLAGELDSPS